MSCDIGEVTERLENQQSSFSNLSVTSPISQLLLQLFRRFTYVTAHSPSFPSLSYVTAHSPSFPSLYLRYSSFSKLSVTLPTSQLILQPFRCSTYVTAHSSTLLFHHLHHSSFSNPPFASPTSQALHLHHLASRPWIVWLLLMDILRIQNILS